MSTRLGGRYQLVREVGAGGMGRVFQAVDTETGRAVAAKIMIANSEDNLEALLRFQQEGAVLSTLKHPNIVEVFGTFLEEHTSCIIMELLEGRSLSQILRAEGALPLPRVKKLAHQVASALAYAHKRAIVHRDVKPDNIMVVGDDHVKVTDFGIARILRTGATLNTATGVSIGTPLYMAPEQIEGQKVDGRADIYSFGAVMFQMVTGHPPFEGDDPLTIAFKHVHKPPPSPSEMHADIPNDWEAVILKALAKDPSERYQTAAALEEAIAALHVAGETRYAPSATPTVIDGQDRKRDRQVDTIDRLLRPEVTGGLRADDGHTVIAPTERPAASAPPAPATDGKRGTIPGDRAPRFDDGATVLRPSRPVDGWDGGQTVLRPSGPDMVAGAAAAAYVADETRLQPRPPIQAPPPRRPTPVPVPQPVTPPARRKLPILPIVGGVVLVAIIGAVIALFTFMNNPKKTATTPTATPTSKKQSQPVSSTNLVPSLTNIGTLAPKSGGTASLQWTNVPGAAKYRLQVATAQTDPSDSVVFAHPSLTTITKRTSFDLKVLGYQYYYWRVQARVGNKWGTYSHSQHFLVPKPSIGRPGLRTPRNGLSTRAKQMQLCWSGVKGANSYTVWVNGASRHVRSTCTTIPVSPRSYRWSVAAQIQAARTYTGPASAAGHFTIQHPPKPKPTPRPTSAPAPAPTAAPYVAPTAAPYVAPTAAPYVAPTAAPYVAPTAAPAPAPAPTAAPAPPPAPAPTSPPACITVNCH